MTGFCKTRVPNSLAEQLAQIQNDPVALKEFGIEFAAQQCQELLTGEYPAPVLHFYTLNLEKVVYGVLEKLGILSPDKVAMANESDAATQVATGSAWARVGDQVTCLYGTGTVLALDEHTAAATVELQLVPNGEENTSSHALAFLQKGKYQKLFG
jgi:methylenetetrahydrofolate reductase (NADPH)